MAARKHYTVAHMDYLRDGYKKMTIEALTVAFNREFGLQKTVSAIRTILHKNKIKCGRKHTERLTKHHRVYTDEHLAWLRQNYKIMGITELTAAFNKEFGMNKTVVQLHGVLNRKKIRANRNARFKSGHRPWNTGTKGATSANKTSFKAGHLPKNTKPVGYERVDKEGYIKSKVSETSPQFEYKHIVIYEQHFGPVPEDHCVIFKDSNIRNFDPSNLDIVSRAELLQMNRNKYKKQPVELKPTVLALSRLQTLYYAKR